MSHFNIAFLVNSKLKRIIFFFLLSLLLFLFSKEFGMFWDNVLFASKIGNYLYNNTVFDWIIPNSFDSGHPPFLGFLLAIMWKIFGHHLWVAHLLMFPFTFGFFYQLFRFIFYYTKSNKIALIGFILILIDPTLSAQLILVNPEIIILFFFFLAINSILYKNYYLKIIALAFLSIISLRSMMICGGIFIFEVINNSIIYKKRLSAILNVKFIMSYFIGSILGISFFIWHYLEKGWFLTHVNSPWVNNHQLVSVKLFFRNSIVLIQRYIDFGRVAIFIFLLFSIIQFKKKIFTKTNKQLFLLSILPISIVIIISLFSTNPFGHRYFIISYIIFNFLAFLILVAFYKKKQFIYLLLMVSLITGNLWIYPRTMSQGWDSSLAHIPYFNLRKKAIKFLDEKNIPIEKTATFFPNITTIDNVDFSKDFRKFEEYNATNNYIFYSNVYNLSDAIYKNLDANYTIIKKFEDKRIHIFILKNNNYDNIRR